MAKQVNLDTELESVKGSKIYSLEDMLEPPLTCDTPEGWSPIRAMDGECWYDRVKGWEARFGKKMLPLKYSYDESGNIILTEELQNGTDDKE